MKDTKLPISKEIAWKVHCEKESGSLQQSRNKRDFSLNKRALKFCTHTRVVILSHFNFKPITNR